jgi:hypothetical protein
MHDVLFLVAMYWVQSGLCRILSPSCAGCMYVQYIRLQDCVNKTIARIKSKLEKEDKRVLNHVVYGLRSTRK